MSVLSAGSGTDIISLNLQKYANNQLKIAVLDISVEVLQYNELLFEEYSFKAEFVAGDIFKLPFKEGCFDLVFNTGVLEHFRRDEQIKMVKEILSVLKPSGYFVTANPSSRGWIYKQGMESAKKKGVWPFGEETPVTSLKFLLQEISEIADIKEYHKDFLSQLGFLSYVNPLFKLITYPIIFSARLLYGLQFLPQLYDLIFAKIFGTYLVVSVVKKKQ